MTDQPASISVKTQLKQDDLYWFIVRAMVRQMWFLAGFLVLFGVLFGMTFLPQASEEQRNKATELMKMFPYFAGAYILLVFVVPFFSARSQFKTSRKMQGGITYTFSDDGFGTSTVASSSQSKWSVMYRASETRSFFILNPSKYISCIIPKRDIPDESTLKQLRQLIRANVKGKVKLLG